MAPPGSCVIWVNPDAGVFILVSEEDYHWAVKWRWHTTLNSTKKKLYATRMTRHPKSRRQRKIYLHKEILLRTGVKPPTKKHTMGDHWNGNSLDCRRDNLRWATTSMNNRNRKSAETPPSAEVDIPF